MKRREVAAAASDFSSRVIAWQARSGRHDLPWQQTRDPYRVWLSEIMLQQTQVGTVVPYFLRFVERFPSVEALAAASIDTVFECWAGLGYYARARNLHRCAECVVSEYGGRFPESPEALATLPGIGRSTAAAIAVFAFGRRAAILDGNVKRVLARCFGVGGFPGAPAVERALWALAESLLPTDGVERYTQGLMDLGATVCTRGAPACDACPHRGDCVARREDRIAELPGAKPGKALPERETTMLLLFDERHVMLERRPPQGIWGGLLSLPEIAGAPDDVMLVAYGCRATTIRELAPVRHTFTHFRLTIRVLACEVRRRARAGSDADAIVWLPRESAARAGVPAPIRRLLEETLV